MSAHMGNTAINEGKMNGDIPYKPNDPGGVSPTFGNRQSYGA